MIQKITSHISKIPKITKLVIIILILITLFGFTMTIIEPKTFPSILEGIWWAIVTTSTVGYGDYTPVTIVGKLIGILLIFIGAGFVTTYFATVSSAAISSEEKLMNGTKDFTEENHYIIVGWNERSKNIISRLHEQKSKVPIVLIDQTLRKHPDRHFGFHFINGKATEDNVLLKANIQKAARILITADFKQQEFQADMFSILTLIASKGLNPNIYSCVEILTLSQMENAKRAGADHIIQTNIFAGAIMVNVLTGENNYGT
ncbi:potassium channel family protein [Bacillus massiliigorillae]|uniref:potassium channel family protein n=1 Tax=Bacillus massiliigorillae TaxID=1243664 RepID=UPI0003A62609|nr:NAD-binding protein [Bacillus massiliigorillae]